MQEEPFNSGRHHCNGDGSLRIARVIHFINVTRISSPTPAPSLPPPHKRHWWLSRLWRSWHVSVMETDGATATEMFVLSPRFKPLSVTGPFSHDSNRTPERSGEELRHLRALRSRDGPLPHLQPLPVLLPSGYQCSELLHPEPEPLASQAACAAAPESAAVSLRHFLGITMSNLSIIGWSNKSNFRSAIIIAQSTDYVWWRYKGYLRRYVSSPKNFLKRFENTLEEIAKTP